MSEEEKKEVSEAVIAAEKLNKVKKNSETKGSAGSFVKGALLGVLVLGVVVVAVVTVVGYKKGWGDSAKETVRKTLNLPVAKVNGIAISYNEYAGDLESARKFFMSDAAAGVGAPTDEEIRDGVLDRLIEQVIVREEATKFGVTVSQEEVDAEFQSLADAEGGDPAQQIQDLYGWTIEQFKEKVMRAYLLEQKLGEALTSDPDVKAPAEAKAQEVLARLDAGEDFATVAGDMSDDPGSAANGGDLGWFAKGIMVEPFETAAFSLAPGERSGLVETQFGYHVIEVTDTKKGDDGEVSEVQARHILVSFPSVSDYLKQKLDEAEVEKLLK